MAIRIRIDEALDRLSDALTTETPVTGDMIPFVDASDSNEAKLATISSILSLVSGGGSGIAVTFAVTPPSNPGTGDIWWLTGAATGLTVKDTDGTTDLTTAALHDVFRYNGTDWVLQTDFSTYLTAANLNGLTTVTPVAADQVALVDVSDSNTGKKSTITDILGLQDPVGPVWLTSGDFSDGSLAADGTLGWTAAAGAPTGAADGSDTQCTLPSTKPAGRVNGVWFRLIDGDNSDAVVREQFVPWLLASPDLEYRLYADADAYAVIGLDLEGVVPTVTVTTVQDSANTLTGMYLTIAASLG